MAKQVIAVIGAGGKTTAMEKLAHHFRQRSVLVTTTTHIMPMTEESCDCCLIDPQCSALENALTSPGIVCAGAAAGDGKLGRLPAEALSACIAAADIVLYEADGSRRLPLKLHRDNEPVLLPETTHVIVFAGLSALGKPVAGVIHRYELDPAWSQAADRLVDAKIFKHCVLETVSHVDANMPVLIFLNQEDCCRDRQQLQEIVNGLQQRGFPVESGSLQISAEKLCEWLVEG